jgi:predicted nucleotidyltransferase
MPPDPQPAARGERTPSAADVRPASARADEQVLAEMVRRLVDELRPQRIYLFGSRARGDAQFDSDYDLMVVVNERVGGPYEMERRARWALLGLRVPVDIVVMTTDYYEWMLGAAASLPATVQREGRLVYAA